MAKEKYTIDGQTYEVETGAVSKNKDGETVQTITINGQKMTLVVQDTRDNTAGHGKSVALKIDIDKKYIKDGGYTGISKSEIYKVFEARQKADKATQLEKVAIYQQQYNDLAKAEASAKSDISRESVDADLLKLTDRQISGKEPLPDLSKRFPWAFASKIDRGIDILTQKFNDDAAYRVACREKLKEIKQAAQKYDWFDDMNISKRKISDYFAMRVSEAENALGLGNNNDERNARLDKALASRKQAEVAEVKKNRTPRSYRSSNDGPDMA